MPISNNYLFSPSLSDNFFDIWAAKGLSTLNDLYENKVFSSFSYLSAKFNPNLFFFFFLKWGTLFKSYFPIFPIIHPNQKLILFLRLDSGQRRLILTIYSKIISLTPSPIDSLKLTWKNDLGIDISISRDQFSELSHRPSIILLSLIPWLSCSAFPQSRVYQLQRTASLPLLLCWAGVPSFLNGSMLLLNDNWKR